MSSFPDRCQCAEPGQCDHLRMVTTAGIHAECKNNHRLRLRMAGVPPNQWPTGPRAAAAEPIAKRSTCIYFGPVTGEARECKTCAGSVRIKLHTCAVFGQCTPAKKLPGVACCIGCDRYATVRALTPAQPAAPPSSDQAALLARFCETDLMPGLPGKRFNASIVACDGGYLLAYRDGWRGSDIYTIPLDDALQPTQDAAKLPLRHTDANYGREDPRLFWHKGRLHLSFIGVVGGRRIKHTNQLFARLTPDGRGVEDVFSPANYPADRRWAFYRVWQKNWQFFDHGSQLHAVYTISPHVVLRVECETTTVVATHQWSPPWVGGTLRGGAAPVLVGDEWYCFFHDRIVVNGLRVYRMGVYTFDAAPPFMPRRMTAEPIMVADQSTKPADQYCSCIFPGGAVHRGGDWLVAMGVHDRWTELWRFDAAWIEERLGGFAEPAGVDPLESAGYKAG